MGEVPEDDVLQERLEAASELADDGAAEREYRAIVADAREDEVAGRVKERAVYALGAVLVKRGQAQAVADLANELRPFFATIAKAKTAKVVRTLVDMVARVPGARDVEEALCNDTIAWCQAEKRKFLRLRVQTRLSELLFQKAKFNEALGVCEALLREVKQMDDKNLLVDVHITEARVHHALRNLPKAKASLTAARSNANTIYVSPRVQANIDMLSGTLHAEEKDYKTAYSYFFESFEAINAMGDAPLALDNLRYMLLCKVMLDHVSDVMALLAGKHGIKYGGPELEALRAVAQARKARSLGDLDAALAKHGGALQGDKLIAAHLLRLGDELLEQNLAQLVQPFSCVEVARVAALIKLPLEKVELKLSQMILDKKLRGTLDQGKGHLVLYPASASDETYTHGLSVIAKMGNVVDSLFKRSQEIE
eukprot:g7932.t1